MGERGTLWLSNTDLRKVLPPSIPLTTRKTTAPEKCYILYFGLGSGLVGQAMAKQQNNVSQTQKQMHVGSMAKPPRESNNSDVYGF